MSAITWEQSVFTEGPEEIEIRRGLLATRVAGGALLLTGLMHGASVLQTAMFGYQSIPVVLGEAVFVGLMMAHIFAGSRAYDASVAFTGLGAACALGGSGFAALWFAYLLLSGAVALLPLVTVVAGGMTGLACLAALPFAMRVTAARHKLIDG